MWAGITCTSRKPLAFPALQRPLSRGRLTLRSASPDDQPNIELNYLAEPEDIRRMLDGMRLAWRILHHAPVAAGWQGPIVGETGQALDQATVTSDSARPAASHTALPAPVPPSATIVAWSCSFPYRLTLGILPHGGLLISETQNQSSAGCGASLFKSLRVKISN
jgi:hypothetical protein